MPNSIVLLSVSELMEENFFIPSYQRGYRWTEQQVTDLLNDIYAFAIKKTKSKEEFYCLQPIVVKAHEWLVEEKPVKGWEVVDGQQRLTTIRILLAYLIKAHLKGDPLKEEYGKDAFSIDYETRSDTNHFLDNIKEDYNDNIDFYYISNTYKSIRKWFEDNASPKGAREKIINTLVYEQGNELSGGAVQVIWYQIDDQENPIESFIRINLGKISLTNSELIKALFLQSRNFSANTVENKEIIQQRQLEIATQWDIIEYKLQQDDFWGFLNKTTNAVASRIEFIFDIIKAVALREDPSIAKKIGTDKYATFRYFYKKFETQKDYESIRTEWGNVMKYFHTFQEWFNNPVWFHYIGFLISVGPQEEIIDLFALLNNDTIERKDQITGLLVNRIKSYFKKVKWIESPDNNVAPYLDITYSPSNHLVRNLLLLFNLEYILLQLDDKTINARFPFQRFKEGRWDVEHIDSQTEKQLKDHKTQAQWLQNALTDMERLEEESELRNRIENFIKEEGKENFEDLSKLVVELAGENKISEEEKHDMGNLVLLDASTNRAYGNALFTTKRKTIILKDRRGEFIPLCTKNAFLKYFDLKGTSRTHWTSEDIRSYRQVIENTLVQFLPQKPDYNVNAASAFEEVHIS